MPSFQNNQQSDLPSKGIVIFLQDDDENLYRHYPQETVEFFEDLAKFRHITTLPDLCDDLENTLFDTMTRHSQPLKYKEYRMFLRALQKLFTFCIEAENPDEIHNRTFQRLDHDDDES